jgi:peptidoglycan LD-endopeptidase CwlK
MDSRRLEDLLPEVADKAVAIKGQCEAAGFGLLIYCTQRSLEDQAILFRKSHNKPTVNAKVAQYRNAGFDFLADVLINVGPQRTMESSVTNAGPGESWHNYGEAFDAVPQVNGQEMWDYDEAVEVWETYGRLIHEAQMTWGGDWSNFPDHPHAQLRIAPNPLRVLSPDQVRQILTDRRLLG